MWMGGKLVRTQQEQEGAARALPGTKGCIPRISRSTRIAELWHPMRAIPGRKGRKENRAPLQGPDGGDSSSPWAGRGLLAGWVSLSPPTHHLGASVSKPASLTPSHPSSLCPARALSAANTGYPRGNLHKEQQVMNLSDIETKESKPGHKTEERQAGNQHKTEIADPLCPGSAVNVF